MSASDKLMVLLPVLAPMLTLTVESVEPANSTKFAPAPPARLNVTFPPVMSPNWKLLEPVPAETVKSPLRSPASTKLLPLPSEMVPLRAPG